MRIVQQMVFAVTLASFAALAVAPAATAHHFLAGPVRIGDECYWIGKDGNVWITGDHYQPAWGPSAPDCDPHDPCLYEWDCPAPTRLI